MAVRLWSNRVRWRPARGLVAAWGVVLGLTAISAAIVFGLVREPPRVAPAAEAASAPAPPRAVSLKLPPRPTDFRILPAAEREAMVETTADGLRLPKISPSGWMPWIAYSRRYEPEGPAARVGLLVINVGADEALMRRAIDELPGEVSLAFLPGTPDLGRWMGRAREHGHESYLMLPIDDPAGTVERGIRPIEATAEMAENVRRLRAAMARAEGYIGLVMPSPGPVSQQDAIARPLVKELADHGLALIEITPPPGGSAMYQLTVELGVGYARTSTVLDYKLASQGIGANLNRMLEWTSEGRPDRPRHEFGVLQPAPQSIDAVVAWRKRVADQSAVALVPIIGHFECRDACMARMRAQPAQLRP
jgi:polysaccharide deacetylase 2 family uncharacterized protein YibQ